jgi:predicted Zn finger-like uncharacterized protein
MLLYTLCPGCQAGYDVTDLLRGKKIRCKSCAQAFSVTAMPRPCHLPAPAPFARPQPQAAATGFAARPLSSFPDAAPPSKLAAITKPGRAGDRLPRQAHRPPVTSNAGAWLGRGGLSIGAIVAFVVLRGCLAISSRSTYPTTYYNPPPPVFVMPKQQQWNNGQNGWPGVQDPNGIDPVVPPQPPSHMRIGPRRDGEIVPVNAWPPQKGKKGQPKIGGKRGAVFLKQLDGANRPLPPDDASRPAPTNRRVQAMQPPPEKVGLPPARKG